MPRYESIYCCNCGKTVVARLTTGKEVYPHRLDLCSLHFYRCDTCYNFVGTHKNDTHIPLGCIATYEIKNARRHIHALIDPYWKDGRIKRKSIYKYLSDKLGRRYHTANIRTIEEAREVYRLAKEFLTNNTR